MAEIRAIVLRAAGINTDLETQYALELAGARADRVHVNRVIEDKSLLDQYQILIFPGGFSYGDDVAAGRIMANQIVHHLAEPVRKFIDDGKLVLGICNGFQVLVKAGILPGRSSKREVGSGKSEASHAAAPALASNFTLQASTFRQEDITITCNDSGKYEDRWVYLAPQTDRCVFIDPQQRLCVPVAHGEGKIVPRSDEVLQRLKSEGYIAFKYVDENGEEGPYPINPNGSVESIAGLTDGTGRVLGLMPHPERYVRRTQHPHWSRLAPDLDPDGIKLFRNAVRYVQDRLPESCTV
jgi:phosphoribosylformylglycinamidine synthase